MQLKSLKNISSPTFFSKHRAYFDLLGSLSSLDRLFGYAFYYDDTLFCLTSHPKHTTSFPYLVLDYHPDYFALDALLFAYSASTWPATIKARFLAQAIQDLPDRHGVLQLMPFMGLVAHQSVLSAYLNIAKLPSLLLTYAQQKKVSYKQLVQITRYESSYLAWFATDILAYIKPSCSVLLHLLESMHDCFHRLGGIEALVTALDLPTLIHNDADSETRLHRINDTVFQLCYPTQFKYNQEVRHCVKTLHLPDSISVTWDDSLETKGFTVSLHISKVDDLNDLSLLAAKKESFKDLLEAMVYV